MTENASYSQLPTFQKRSQPSNSLGKQCTPNILLMVQYEPTGVIALPKKVIIQRVLINLGSSVVVKF